jgi:hypothetical protein
MDVEFSVCPMDEKLWKSSFQWFKNSNRLEFPTESYGDFIGHGSAERVLFRILFLLYVFITNF